MVRTDMMYRRPNSVSLKYIQDNIAIDIHKKLSTRLNKGTVGLGYSITKMDFEEWITESCLKRGYIDKKMMDDPEFGLFIEKEYPKIIHHRIRKCPLYGDINPFYFPLLIYQWGYKDYIIADDKSQIIAWKTLREEMLRRYKIGVDRRYLSSVSALEYFKEQTGVKKLHGYKK